MALAPLVQTAGLASLPGPLRPPQWAEHSFWTQLRLSAPYSWRSCVRLERGCWTLEDKPEGTHGVSLIPAQLQPLLQGASRTLLVALVCWVREGGENGRLEVTSCEASG